MVRHASTGKRQLAVVMGVTPDFAFAASGVLQALRRFPPSSDFDVILFHSGIGEKDCRLLSAILPCRFVSYSLPEVLRERMGEAVLRNFSELTFSRYECFALLEEYERVVWLDVDLLIRGDTSELPGLCRNGIAMALERLPLRFNFHGEIDGVDMERPFFNAGIFVLSRVLPGRKSAREWLYEATARHAEQLVMPDQGILNLWLLAHGVVPDSILPHFNWFRHVPGGERAKILHTVGHRKPWTDFRDRAWNGDYMRWIAEGGTPCSFRKMVLQLLSRSRTTGANPFLLPLVRIAEVGRFLVLNVAFVAAGKLVAISRAAKKNMD